MEVPPRLLLLEMGEFWGMRKERERERKRESVGDEKTENGDEDRFPTRYEKGGESAPTTEGRSFERKTVESLTWHSPPIAAPT